jgi:hypothetical protein
MQHSVDFFQALCNMTSGMMLPLTTADLLAFTIVGSVLENMDMERLITGKLIALDRSPGQADNQKLDMRLLSESNRKAKRCRASRRSLSKLPGSKWMLQADIQGITRETDAAK